jgi:cystathionine gamma-synthase
MNAALSPETLAAQALGKVGAVPRGLVPPIHPATTYERDPDGSYPSGLAYTHANNPTYEPAEQLLTALEGGAGCVLFASGSAAASAVFQSLLPGDHVLVTRVLYWGIRKWLAEFALTWGLDVEFLDTTDLTAVAAAIRPGRARLLWLETPANCGGSPTSPLSLLSPMRPVCEWLSIAPWPPRCSPGPSNVAPISWSTPPPNI